ncbi:glycosyltransferase (plasmid) [Aggregatilineales bacterium SYSU G02658]
MVALPLGITIILATHNRAESLRMTLDSLAAVHPPTLPWEVLIVDNASTDHTQAVIAAFTDRLPIVALDEPCLGKSYALNTAIPRGRYELKLFTDDDVLFDANWLLAYERALHDHLEAGYFGGPIHLKLPNDEVPVWAQDGRGQMAVWIRNSLSYFDETILVNSPDSYYGANMAVRQQTFNTCGLYETIKGHIGKKRWGSEETSLQARFNAAGVLSAYVPDALIYHCIRPDEMTVQSRLNARLWTGRSRAKNNYLAGTQKRLNLRRTFSTLRFALALGVKWPFLPPHTRLEQRGDLMFRWGYEYQMWRMLVSDEDIRGR